MHIKKGIVLKGDIAIGIYRHGCDAWVAPELYNMNEQAGAPPGRLLLLWGKTGSSLRTTGDGCRKMDLRWWKQAI